MIIKATDARGKTVYFNSDHIISFQAIAEKSIIQSPICTHVKMDNGEQFYCFETAEELYSLLREEYSIENKM